ncbi:Glutamine methyltransferase [Giardia muris]|uniref:Glutamine methyltransferase n=1 Tax=Giardia muris TaxID=5742 RepID=A0A4Z1SY79_GIAMU|nr:Glutamine methyltransferase [Giardia muris]|eukprot:TNJ26633.1 Glutamine methyltransferase [Giardia muris]
MATSTHTRFIANSDDLRHVYLPDEDTYLLIDAFSTLESSPQAILEIGVGSGLVISHALQRYPEARGLGIDINPYALDMARRTAELNGVVDRLELRLESYDELSSETFDLILFNPPYVPSQERTLSELQAQLPLDQALNGGVGGRLIIDDFLPYLPRLLSKKGRSASSASSACSFRSLCLLLAIEANDIPNLRELCERLGLSSTILRTKRLQSERLCALQITLATTDGK